MQAIARIEQVLMDLPTFGNRGVIVQEDYLNELSASQWTGDNLTVHYHDSVYNPRVDSPDYHQYPCSPDCEYCQAMQVALKDGKQAWELVSYEKFNAKYPILIDSTTGEEYRDTPAYFGSSNLNPDNYIWHSTQYSSDQADSSGYDDPSYDEYDVSGYQYGYTPDEDDLCELSDRSIFRKINWRNLSVIGAGQSSVTISDGKYAIKIGNIWPSDIESIRSASKHGFSIPVFFYSRDYRISGGLIHTLMNQTIMKYGYDVSWSDYVNRKGYASIAILGLADTFVDHDSDLDSASEEYAVCYELARQYRRATGDTWHDTHPYNVGYYKGGLVILDF